MCGWKCPECGSDHHSGCNVGSQTLSYFQPVYKNGANINPDMNTTTYQIFCHACQRRFTAKQCGDVWLPCEPSATATGACGNAEKRSAHAAGAINPDKEEQQNRN